MLPLKELYMCVCAIGIAVVPDQHLLHKRQARVYRGPSDPALRHPTQVRLLRHRADGTGTD